MGGGMSSALGGLGTGIATDVLASMPSYAGAGLGIGIGSGIYSAPSFASSSTPGSGTTTPVASANTTGAGGTAGAQSDNGVAQLYALFQSLFGKGPAGGTMPKGNAIGMSSDPGGEMGAPSSDTGDFGGELGF